MNKTFTELAKVCCALVFLILTASTSVNAQYCESTATDIDDAWMTNVTFAGIDNDSGADLYSDFTDISGVVVPGVTYEFSTTVAFSNIEYTEKAGLWIDWNQNEIFEPEELYVTETCNTQGCVLTTDVEVPIDAIPGETRMRVHLRFGANPIFNPCGSFAFDEVEDYSINVNSGECTPPSFTFDVINDCAADTYSVSSVINDYGTNTFVTIIVTRSDEVPANDVNLLAIAVPPGSTVPIINNVPFGVSVSLSIEGQNPICNLTRNFTEEICPAENDEACTATPLVCGDNFSDLVFEGATQSFDDACSGSGTADVWFTFTADGTQSYTVAETQTDVVVDLWEGDDCGNLTQVSACADFPESVTVYDAGTYYFRIRPWSTATTYGVSLTCAPFDCEELGGDIGTACDDGDAGTVNDEITADCECIGEPVAANDEACTATLLECGDALLGQSFAGSSQSFDDACSGSGTGDVWFTFVADGTQTYTIAETQTDVVVDLWSGDCGDLTPVSACADFPESVEVTEAGTYYFRIRPWGSATTFGVSLTCTPFDCPDLLANIGDACDDGDAGTVNDLITEDCVCAGVTPASNDEPCTAIALACNDTLVDQTFLGATVSIEDGCTNPTNGDVWYSFTAMEGMAYQINEPSTNSTTASLYIAEDGDCETLTEVVGCTTFFNSFTITEPGDYFFRIRAYSTQISHSVGFICTEIPVNDECTEALPLTCGETYTGSTLGSTAYPEGQPFCITAAPSAGNGGVWYSITPDNDTEIDLDLTGSEYDTKLFLYTGTCDGLVCVDGDDDGGEGLDSRIEATLTAGTTYYVFVTGFSANRGEYLLNVNCVDLVCSPTIESAVAVDSEGALLDCVDLNGEYFLEVTLAGGTQASYNVSVGDSPVTVIDADGTGIVGPVSGVNVTITAVGTVNPNCGAAFDYVSTPCPPSNDEACNATPISCGETIAQNYVGATLSETCGTGSGTADVWFVFTADGTQAYTIADVGPGFFDAVVGLYQGDDCGNLVSVAPCADFPESYTITEAGVYYFYIRPWSAFTTTLTGNVSLTCTPFDCPGVGNIGVSCDDGDPNTVNDVVTEDCECAGEPVIANDEACTATVLECGDALTDQTFAGSSQSFDDACSGSGTGDVWYTFVADGTQSYNIAETQTDVVVDLWVGDDCGELTPVFGCSDFPENFSVNDAGTYYFRIRPWGSATTYGVSLTCTPFDCPDLSANIGDACDDGDENTVNDEITADCECVGTPIPVNDLCADAVELVCDVAATGTTVGASNTGAPSAFCGTSSGAPGVWYTIDGNGGDIDLSLCGSSYDTKVQVYTGACDELVCVGGNDDSCGLQSEYTIAASENGVTYYVYVYGFSTATGAYTITATCNIVDVAAFNGSVNWNSNCDDRMSTVTFYEPNTATVAATYETMVNSAGDFSIPSVLVGTYDIIVDVPGYLNKGLADVETVVGDNNVDFGNITGGDANDNNNINVADFSGLNSAFGSVTGDANYLLFADFNCSGSINVADFSGLNAAFGQGGAIAPLP